MQPWSLFAVPLYFLYLCFEPGSSVASTIQNELNVLQVSSAFRTVVFSLSCRATTHRKYIVTAAVHTMLAPSPVPSFVFPDNLCLQSAEANM